MPETIIGRFCDILNFIYLHTLARYQRRTSPSSMWLSRKILYLRSYTWLYLMRDCIEELLPTVTIIINLSLQTAVMPNDLKEELRKLLLDLVSANIPR